MEFKLQGKRLKGNFALIRFKPKKQWLLIKMKDKNISS
jgi:hypothetical protein